MKLSVTFFSLSAKIGKIVISKVNLKTKNNPSQMTNL